MPIRFRSGRRNENRSIPACCWTSTAADSALMRAPARGPSGMFTRSTPRIRSVVPGRRATPCGTPERHELDADDELTARETVRHRDFPGARRSAGGGAVLASPALNRGAIACAERERVPPSCVTDVFGFRSAASPAEPHAPVDEPARVRRHVLRRAQVDMPPLYFAGTAGIGLADSFTVAACDSARSSEHRGRVRH